MLQVTGKSRVKAAARCLLLLLAALCPILFPAGSLLADKGKDGSLPGVGRELSVTQEEAVAWAAGKTGRGIDYDGAYGAQSVDFIKAYYAYLGVEPIRGSALSYTVNELPEGFTRLQNASPRPGDILLYTGGNEGHAAIYESDYVSYHQGWGGSFVTRYISYYQQIGKNHRYWGVIRPPFSGGSEEAEQSKPPEMKIADWKAPSVLNQGDSFIPEGRISSGEALTGLTVGVYDPDGKEMLSFKAKPMVRNYSLDEIAETVSFRHLKSGIFEYRLTAENSSGSFILLSSVFAVKSKGRTVPDGLYKIASSLNDSYMLTVAGWSKSEGANIRLFRYLPYDATEDFAIIYEDEGLYRIRNNNSGLYLTLGGREKDGSRNIFQSAEREDGSQLFSILTDGADHWFFLPRSAPALAVSIHDGRVYDTANIRAEMVNMGVAQQFTLFDAYAGFKNAQKDAR
ncbi:MAG: RICIN domain-containing protein [Lachnospiraceae bacterium]|nr:RICIN domain-containing protein [Lachnospiraceae bacterium]